MPAAAAHPTPAQPPAHRPIRLRRPSSMRPEDSTQSNPNSGHSNLSGHIQVLCLCLTLSYFATWTMKSTFIVWNFIWVMKKISVYVVWKWTWMHRQRQSKRREPIWKKEGKYLCVLFNFTREWLHKGYYIEHFVRPRHCLMRNGEGVMLFCEWWLSYSISIMRNWLRCWEKCCFEKWRGSLMKVIGLPYLLMIMCCFLIL